jgi:hypothetical protein
MINMKALFVLTLLTFVSCKVSLDNLLYSFKLNLDETYFGEEGKTITLQTLKDCNTYSKELWCHVDVYDLWQEKQVRTTRIHVYKN